MKKVSLLESDVSALPLSRGHVCHKLLIQNSEARTAWERLIKFPNVNRLHVLAFIPDCMRRTEINPCVPGLLAEHKEKHERLFVAVDILIERLDGLSFPYGVGEQAALVSAGDFLRQLRDHIALTKSVGEDFFTNTFPSSQKRKDKRLAFQKMLSSHLEAMFNQPLIDFSAAIGFALYSSDEPVDLEAVRRAHTRERAKRRSVSR